jgi:hypothetical protein
MHAASILEPPLSLAIGVAIPDSQMAREVTELIRDTESALLRRHHAVCRDGSLA